MNDAQFPKIKIVDLALKPNIVDSRLMKGEMDFSKGDAKNVTTKIVDKDMRLRKAGIEYKIKPVIDFKI